MVDRNVERFRQADNFSMAAKVEVLEVISADVRRSVFETIYNANSGHLGGNSSSVELMVALYFGGVLNYNPENDKDPDRDVVLVRGHEGPLRYKIFSLIGYLPEEDLRHYRQLGANLQGHEDMKLTPGVDITPSGSLGMVLSYGAGAALTFKTEGKPNRVVVFLGDGEEQEGNVSEAARHIATQGLDNIVCILDQNSKQLSRRTADSDGASDIEQIWQGYGWDTIHINNGHDISEILDVYQRVFSQQDRERPVLIVAHTIKGKGLPGVEDHFSGAHTIGAFRNHDGVLHAISEQGSLIKQHDQTPERIRHIASSLTPIKIKETRPTTIKDQLIHIEIPDDVPLSLEGAQIPYFHRLTEIINNNPNSPNYYILTPDFVLEPLVDIFKLKQLGTYVDTGIREQHNLAMAHGISTTDPSARVVIFYGDAFIYRAMDQLNAGAQGGSKAILFSERAGICQGKNGSTHQTVGQPGAILTNPHVIFKEPGDVRDLYNVLNWHFSENAGWVYLRTHSKKTPFLERDNRDLNNLDFFVTHDTDQEPDLVLVGSGLTVHNSIDAARRLEMEYNIHSRVINVVDPNGLCNGFGQHIVEGAPVFTVYNGNPNVLQMPVCKAIVENPDSPRPSYVVGHGFNIGTSGSVEKLERYYQLDSEGITNLVLKNIR